jgi:hypothetical protein
MTQDNMMTIHGTYSGNEMRPQPPRSTLITSWALLCGVAPLLATAVFVSLAAHGGLGLVREGGRYLLRQGTRTEEIGQLWGQILGCGLLLTFLSLLALATTALMVFIREGTVELDHVLRRPADLRLSRAVRLMWVISSVLAGGGLLLWLGR